jgi:hypothetical protein
VRHATLPRHGVVGRDLASCYALLHHQRDDRIDIVQGLAQINGEVLRLLRAFPPGSGGADAGSHGGNRHTGGNTEMTANNGIPSGEYNLASGIRGAAANAPHEFRESAIDIESRGAGLGYRHAGELGG